MTLIQGKKKGGDEQFTPSWLFKALDVTFDLDPAHPEEPTNVPCKTFFTKKQNGLEQNWHGFVWMNPPFSESKLWVEKFLEHDNGLMLIPMSKAKWFLELWNNPKAQIVALPASIKFDLPNGLQNSIFTLTCIVACGVQAHEVLFKANLGQMR